MSEHPTRWLVTGAAGMLGHDLVELLAADGTVELTALTRTQLDVTDRDAVRAAVAGADVVVNAAAWTDVDGAETEQVAATKVNGAGPRTLAFACHEHRAVLLHVSTDYVFAGDGATPYAEDAPTDPINAYGRGKLVGEQAVLHMLPERGYVVRTAWLYGAHGRNFVTTMLDLAGRRDTVNVVDDQRGQPTWSRALAERLIALGHRALAGAAPAGVYHGTAAGETTWYGLAREVFALAGLDPDRVRPVTSAEFVRLARRPGYSVLGHDRWGAAGLPPMADWRSALREAVGQLR